MILVTVAVAIVGFALSGGLLGALGWGVQCGSAVVEDLWSPLLDNRDATPPPPKPAAVCLHADAGPAAG
jgi:hypothetical protein